MHACHRNDPLGRVELGLGERAMAFEAGDRFSGTHAPAELVAVDFGIEVADLEPG
jgi:hypothetical protein